MDIVNEKLDIRKSIEERTMSLPSKQIVALQYVFL